MKIISGTISELLASKRESTTGLWRWYVLEANNIFTSSSTNATDSWKLHLIRRDAAEACCRDGDISAARLELNRALETLRGVSLSQMNLI